MQPFDALTIRAVLEEARPLLLNRRVDKVLQLGRDEVLLNLRAKAGIVNLILSAQASYGRICLVKGGPGSGINERSPINNSAFAVLLRKNLSGAHLVHVEQITGERIIDFVFSCTDEVGTASHKVLTAEIMGRHSNLIFWDKASEKIMAASHIVTRDMSRQREVAAGLAYRRPPGQDKPNLFKITNEQFSAAFDELIRRSGDEKPVDESRQEEREDSRADGSDLSAAESDRTDGRHPDLRKAVQTLSLSAPPFATVEQWLISTFTGLGRHLAEELVLSASVESVATKAVENPEAREKLWEKVDAMRQMVSYKPAMKTDLSRYSVLSFHPEIKEHPEEWKTFPAVNDLIEEYYRLVEAREHFNHLREKLRNELRGEADKLVSRLSIASEHMMGDKDIERLKRMGDLVLTNQASIGPGQEELVCTNLYSENGEEITIKLNPNLSAAQNAQTFYRQFSKSRNRHHAAQLAHKEASARRAVIDRQMSELDEAKTSEDLKRLREAITGRKPQEAIRAQPQQKKKSKSRLIQLQSSDGWTIYVGRNRQENDHLLNRLAQPNDIWLHNLGQGGAHVLIRVPGSKQEPPLTTIREAAQVAARLSKASAGSKVRVVYTQCKHVKKLGKDKPGMVRYENEKTLEVDTSQPMPRCMKQLFA